MMWMYVKIYTQILFLEAIQRYFQDLLPYAKGDFSIRTTNHENQNYFPSRSKALDLERGPF